MALLYLLAADERPDWAPAVVAAHVHHGLRGEAADADEARVARLAERLGVPFRRRALDPEALRAEGKRRGSLEEAMRLARYGALADVARRGRCDAVLTAHHQDDLAETFLMRLLRGSGLTGLAGFAAESLLGRLRVVRPLIEWSRADLRRVARDAGLDWGEDATNRDTHFLRNRVRRQVLPCLERATDHPPVARMLARTARRLEREARALMIQVAALYAAHRLERARPRRVGLPGEALVAQGEPAPLAPYLLRMLMAEMTADGRPPAEERIAELCEFAVSAPAGALLQTAGSVVAWKAPDAAVWFYRKPRRQIERRALLALFRRA